MRETSRTTRRYCVRRMNPAMSEMTRSARKMHIHIGRNLVTEVLWLRSAGAGGLVSCEFECVGIGANLPLEEPVSPGVGFARRPGHAGRPGDVKP